MKAEPDFESFEQAEFTDDDEPPSGGKHSSPVIATDLIKLKNDNNKNNSQ